MTRKGKSVSDYKIFFTPNNYSPLSPISWLRIFKVVFYLIPGSLIISIYLIINSFILIFKSQFFLLIDFLIETLFVSNHDLFKSSGNK